MDKLVTVAALHAARIPVGALEFQRSLFQDAALWIPKLIPAPKGAKGFNG